MRQDHRELFAAVSRGQVDAAARHGEEDLTHLAQRLVADLVSELVVERLELVEVEHEQRERRAVAMRTPALLKEPLLEVTVVVQAREPVADGLLLGAPVQPLVLERRRRLVGQHLQRLALGRREAAVAVGLDDDGALRPVLDGERDGQARAVGGDTLGRPAGGERLQRELAGGLLAVRRSAAPPVRRRRAARPARGAPRPGACRRPPRPPSRRRRGRRWSRAGG